MEAVIRYTPANQAIVEELQKVHADFAREIVEDFNAPPPPEKEMTATELRLRWSDRDRIEKLRAATRAIAEHQRFVAQQIAKIPYDIFLASPEQPPEEPDKPSVRSGL